MTAFRLSRKRERRTDFPSLTLRTWKVEAEFAWQLGELRCLAFSSDGMLAAAGGTGKKIVVWDVDL